MWIDYPADDTYWLRLAKAGATYSAAYSLDGESWTDFPVEVENAALAEGAAVGPFALGVFQDAPIWAAFDQFTLAGDGPGGTPALKAAVQPKRKTVGKRKRQTAFTFKVRNTGDAPTGKLTLCAKAPSKRLRVIGKDCRQTESLAAKAAITPKFKFRIKRAARGKTTEIKFVARSAGLKNQSAVAKLRGAQVRPS